MDSNSCNITAKTKLRNGYQNWWCTVHCASARGPLGSKLDKCLKAETFVYPEKQIRLGILDYKGGVGVWGALEAVFDTKREIPDSGVHVHLRRNIDDLIKEVDETFDEVYLKINASDPFEAWIKIDKEIACAYTASVVFEKELKVLTCTHCGEIHIDAEYFAVHAHKKHFCTFCGRDFMDSRKGISNPVAAIQRKVQNRLGLRSPITKVGRVLDIKQVDYPGGIQIWGSNPAIIWTATRNEESGIHVHLFDRPDQLPISDDTYGRIIIDGIELDDKMIRYFMVQQSLDYLSGKLASLNCPACGEDHFDTGDFGLNPHLDHICDVCQHSFQSSEKVKKVVSNPIIRKLQKLKEITI